MRLRQTELVFESVGGGVGPKTTLTVRLLCPAAMTNIPLTPGLILDANAVTIASRFRIRVMRLFCLCAGASRDLSPFFGLFSSEG